MDRLDAVLAELGTSYGMADLKFDGDELRLEIGQRSLDMIADRKRDAIILTTLVGDLPEGDRAEILGYLLDLNTGPALAGAALGVPAGSQAIVLTDQLAAAELSTEWLRGRIKAFLGAVDTARTLVAGPRSTEAAGDAERSELSSSSMMRV